MTGVNEYPEAFEWVDGRDGRDHLHLPLALVSRVNGDLAFVDAMPRILLRRDPELGGTRRRIELECMARGASYEIWTEDEILEDRSAVQVLRVAGTAERASHASALRSLQAPMAGDVPILTAMAGRLLVDDLRAVGAGWVGRSRLTGIPMALLCDMEVDPETRMFVWRPRSPAGAGQRAAGNHPGGEASASARDDAP
ncbi:hypothetical protein [Antarcticirhabdus aurantiaca]|uniref:Uncharacterized protein n=1 Tax=Antarcticirhabdus aurantiaca TaxID=2606717 RepID=A0ACD4NR86_9HYPH|nr:hypothetical protein [Antarcticirhabdus aurantiaca]WAJ29436.1 hypothetical protein OXU80_04145 [Jeongeuplla avenae]